MGEIRFRQVFGFLFSGSIRRKGKKATLKGLTGKLLRRPSLNIQNKCLKKQSGVWQKR